MKPCRGHLKRDLLIAVLLLSSLGCSRRTSELALHRKFNGYKGETTSDGITVLMFDLNADGMVDFREYWTSETKLVRAESDRNGDTKPDKWAHFGDPSGMVLEIDDDFDGVIDRRFP